MASSVKTVTEEGWFVFPFYIIIPSVATAVAPPPQSPFGAPLYPVPEHFSRAAAVSNAVSSEFEAFSRAQCPRLVSVNPISKFSFYSSTSPP